MDDVRDNQLGVSIRFIREWKPDTDLVSDLDVAMHLASQDDGDEPFIEKVMLAMSFIQSRRANG